MTGIYILRGADFGTDFTQKLLLSILAVGLVIWDMRAKNRLDYLWVFLTGALIWTAAEYALQVTGAREIQRPQLFGYDLPLLASTLLQGMAEGAFVAVFALFVADRFQEKNTRRLALSLLAGICLIILFRAFFPEAEAVTALSTPPSRRNILAPRALTFIASMSLFNAIFWIRYKAHRRRSFGMAWVMVALVSVWTVGQVAMGSRWVEVGGTTASVPVAILTLTFDIIFEMMMAYIPFYAIPAFLGLLQKENPGQTF